MPSDDRVVPPSFASLPDGRRLAFNEYGDTSGVPVINCHGGLTSRLDVERCSDVARRVGVRIISPDRPGIGRSDPKPDRTLLGWSDDVSALANVLGLERFGVLGWSAGGPFAAACAYALADRVTAAALVASAVPGDWLDMMRDINRTDRVLLRLSFHARPGASLALHAMRAPAAHLPKAFRKASWMSLDKPSRRVVLSEPVRFFSGPIAEGLRRPRAVIEDYRLFGSPWGFALDEIRVPVTLWQGDSDGLVPPQWGQRLADAIPGATLAVCRDEGHFLTLERYHDILTTFLAAI
jgi:pimeloyl-ACP methyl ester carboxylesterase